MQPAPQPVALEAIAQRRNSATQSSKSNIEAAAKSCRLDCIGDAMQALFYVNYCMDVSPTAAIENVPICGMAVDCTGHGSEKFMTQAFFAHTICDGKSPLQHFLEVALIVQVMYKRLRDNR